MRQPDLAVVPWPWPRLAPFAAFALLALLAGTLGCGGRAGGIDAARVDAAPAIDAAQGGDAAPGIDAAPGHDAAGPDRPEADLTGPWQLFVDDALIADRQGVMRAWHAFDKHPGNPVMVADRPWEDRYVYLYGRVMPGESGGYRMWYAIIDFSSTDGGSRVAYAESADGLAWTKPELGIRTWQGSTANNLFIPRDRPNHIMSVLHTPWDPDPGCRYRLINYDGAYGALAAGYNAACSADGVHLVDHPANPVLPGGADVAQFLWDPFAERYLGYMKTLSYAGGYRRRAVGRLETADFGSWPTSAELVLEPDSDDDLWATSAGLDLLHNRTHFYGLSVFPYQGMFLGFLWVFRAVDPPGCTRDCASPYEGYIFGKIHVELVSSRDGVHFTRVDADPASGRPPLLPLGPAGAWDSMMVLTANHPVRLGDRLRMYYGGCDEDHGEIGTDGRCSIGLATLRVDGFASLDAGAAPGTVTTPPLTGARGPLRLNHRTESGGSIRVAILDAAGVPLAGHGAADCDPIDGDSIDRTVTWGGRADLPAGDAPLRLRFHLERASLFSFAAGDGLAVSP